MRFEKVALLGLECVDAPEVIPSSAIVQQLSGTFDRLGIRQDLLESVAGIRSRRFWKEGTMPSDAATMAAEKVLGVTQVDRDRIGLLINSSVCRDYLEPSTACLVHGNLGLPAGCLNYDLGNACLAFLNSMEMASAMIEAGSIDYALIVDGESSRSITEATVKRLQAEETTLEDVHSQFASLTLGSGAVAMILARADLHPECTHRFLGGVSLAATEHRNLCRGVMDWMVTNTKKLLGAGIELASKTWCLAQSELGWSCEALDVLILHQVSQVHTASLLQALGLDPDRALLTFPEFGNVGPASVPMALAKALEVGKIDAGQRIALMGIGSGLNCTFSEVVW
jgi:3-oxoacyl-[acyl-carrier-protein] synthase-3